MLTSISVHLESASNLNGANCYDHKSLQVFIDLNLSLLAILRSQAQVAQQTLAPIEVQTELPPLVKTWVLDFKGRIAALENDWQGAEKAFSGLSAWGQKEKNLEAQWRANLGLANISLAKKQMKQALAYLSENDRRAQQAAKRISIHEERSRYFSLKQQNTQLLLQTLVEKGELNSVLLFLRASRRRVLDEAFKQFKIDNRSAQKRAQVERYVNVRKANATTNYWMLSEQEFQQQTRRDAATRAGLVSKLAQTTGAIAEKNAPIAKDLSPPVAELNLYLHQDRLNTLVIAVGPEQRLMRRFDRVPSLHPHQLGHLLAPFLRQLDNVEHVNLFPSGEFANIPIHRIQYRNQTLGEAKTLLYRLDLVDLKPDFSWPHEGMLLLGDSREDLPQSIKEVRSLASLSNERGMTLMGQAITYSAVRTQLGKYPHVHYSGHGNAEGQSWQSSFALYDDDDFTIGDILTLEKVPNSLILSACLTGGNQVETLVKDWNVVNAFLIAGSQWVIGSPEPVADVDAYQFMHRLYQYWKAEDDLLVAWKATQGSLKNEISGSTWQHFRLYAK